MVCSILVRRILSILMVAAIGVAGMVSAAAIEPADNIIRNALIDIEKYESQAAGLTPSRASNANRILKLMALSKQRLDGSPHKDDPSWTAVNGRYLALEAQLNSLLNPSTSTAAAAAPSSAPSSAAASIPSSSPGSDATPTIESAAAQAAPLVSGERVRVKKLARDMASARSDMTTSGPSPLQDANIVAARQKSLQQFAAALERYPQLDDPDVQAAHREYEALRKALSAEYERAREQLVNLATSSRRWPPSRRTAGNMRPPRRWPFRFQKARPRAGSKPRVVRAPWPNTT